MLGDWQVRTSGPDNEPDGSGPWSEHVRSLQGLWIVCEGQGTMPGGSFGETLMTLGNPYDGERRAGTVGLPLPGVHTRIVERGADVADGERGELWIRSPTVCAGYWNRPDATAAAFTDDWFRTGDIASRADDGYITLHGRRSDLIISGGFNIYPREVEEVLYAHRSVAEAAVVGTKDPRMGEEVVAFVVPKEGETLSAEEIIGFCESRLARFKCPKQVRFVPSLPKSPIGKVLRKELRTQV